MIVIFCFLSLLAGDTVKVHREPPGSEQWLCRDAEIQGKPCWVPEHYFLAVITEKCDTVVHWERNPIQGMDSVGFRGNKYGGYGYVYYDYHCHPETTLVDSGVKVTAPLIESGVQYVGSGRLVYPDGYISTGEMLRDSARYRIRPSPPLDSAELADIREMLREWPRLLRRMAYYDCLDTLKLPPDTLCFFGYMDTVSVFMARPTHYPTIKDSCECVYGTKKGQIK